MADTAPLIDFSIIEPHKENIQSLPSGRSAKQLAQLYSPPLTSRPSPSTSSVLSDEHSTARAALEAELDLAHEADDPLDCYVRYVQWILDTYPSGPSASSTSGLAPLLERATKTFLPDARYRDDARYLKLWLQYISFYSDAPRDAFVFLARQQVGAGLALFYEEYAAWLEGQGRWTQAEEVFSTGIDKGARPVERLSRKCDEFQRRRANLPAELGQRPDSPALPIVRAVLGQKIDPFAAIAGTSQQAERDSIKDLKVSKKKMAIFADTGDVAQSAMGSQDGQSWDGIGSLQSRKKENTSEATSWSGQTLKVGKTNAGMGKMQIFKSSSTTADTKMQRNSESRHKSQVTVNAKGRREVVFVNLDMLYPASGGELSFEEVMATHRRWLEKDWPAEKQSVPAQEVTLQPTSPEKKVKKKGGFEIFQDSDSNGAANQVQPPPYKDQRSTPTLIKICNDENNENVIAVKQKSKEDDIVRRMRKEERANRTRKIKMTEVRQEKKETQTVQLNLASPTGSKIKRKKTAEATMTINTKEAMDEIYDMFNQPAEDPVEEEEDDADDSDDDYTSGAESTATGRMSGPASEYGDETRREILQAQLSLPQDTPDEVDVVESEADVAEQPTEVTGWSDFTMNKHAVREESSGQVNEVKQAADLEIFHNEDSHANLPLHPEVGLLTPQEDDGLPETRYVPLPPEDYEPNNGTYRNSAFMANNRLPFMTPIAEQTESSIGTSRSDTNKDYFSTKTPSRQTAQEVHPILEDDEEEPLSSPFQEQMMEAARNKQALLMQTKLKARGGIIKGSIVKVGAAKKALTPQAQVVQLPGGPIIAEQQLNPVDPLVREIILARMSPSLSANAGFHDHRDVDFGHVQEIRRFAKTAGAKKAGADNATAMSLSFPDSKDDFSIRRELGAGAFAPVYLVERHAEQDDEKQRRAPFEALKMETAPPSAWEYHMIQLTHRRLNGKRGSQSVVHAHECHLYRDASFLIEDYSDNGTLLDLVNLSRGIEGCNGGAGAGLEESLAMFYTVELLRFVEGLHAQGLIHGDLKADNVMVRMPRDGSPEWSSSYCPHGTGAWERHGVTVIDFGRGIDMRAFRPDVRFEADWATSEADCVEMRELRPWTHQVDYHGLAGTAHTLLFGKYMSVVPDRSYSSEGEAVAGALESGGPMGPSIAAAKRWRTRENPKRYWQTELWNDLFSLLLNSAHPDSVAREEGRRMPLLRGLQGVRERMERWLQSPEGGGRDGGLGVRLRRLEDAAVGAKRMKR